MTASTFGWLDHDEAERRRMMEIVDMFRDKGTLDELGIGTIRDTVGEHFFPGTSTIYWQGLQRWGIRLFEGSTDCYHATLDRHYHERACRGVVGGR